MLTPQQWKDRTIRDIKRKQEIREKGKLDADSFLAENRIKTNLRKNRIRAKCYK